MTEILAGFTVALVGVVTAMLVNRIGDRRARRRVEETWAVWEETWDRGEG
jgi:hypothetical protein